MTRCAVTTGIAHATTAWVADIDPGPRAIVDAELARSRNAYQEDA